MDFGVKNAINIRKESIFEYYNIKDNAILEEIEEFFKKLSDLGESVEGVMDFESKFANSDLNEKYLDLLKKISLKCTIKEEHKQIDDLDTKEDLKEDIKEEAKSKLEYLGEKAFINTGSAIDKEFGITEKIRKDPIVGNAIGIKNNVEKIISIKNIFKKRRENKKDKDSKDRDTE